MGNSLRSFQELECWKAARQLRIFISEIISNLPKNEFELIDNIKRAARSATRNIAEGYGRFHYQENIQFCRMSRGSITEIWDDLITCFDEKYISEEKFKQGVLLVESALKILNGYIFYLEKAKSNQLSSAKESEEIYSPVSKLDRDSTTQ